MEQKKYLEWSYLGRALPSCTCKGIMSIYSLHKRPFSEAVVRKDQDAPDLFHSFCENVNSTVSFIRRARAERNSESTHRRQPRCGDLGLSEIPAKDIERS